MVTSTIDHLLTTSAKFLFPAAAMQVNVAGEVAYQRAIGWYDPEQQKRPINSETRFDLASLTKLVTTTAVLKLISQQELSLDTPIAYILTDFRGQRPIQPYEDPLNAGQWVTVAQGGGNVDASQITVRQLLTHSSGLPAWRPIYQQLEGEKRPFVIHTFFSYSPDSTVVYSDLGFILLGWLVEAVLKRPLTDCFQQLVFDPLMLDGIGFGPVAPASCAPTEWCGWRQRRMHGEVHDENSFGLGGVAGHAGLFGTAAAVAGLGQAWLDVVQGRSDFLRRELAKTAVSLQAQSGNQRRGLGWALWSPDAASASHPLGHNSFGHTGFTGTSLYIDPDHSLVVAALTNEVYNGRANRGIGAFRVRLHEAVSDWRL